ncbi:MAG: xanthine dehydrogenase family protein subunit M, partial [Firmicutes bacterium]|nr:xanthine dehydrogenase family protein subunit M [Bacillota bacterium]
GDEDAKLIAGGHSLLPLMKMRLVNPGKLIDIGDLSALRGSRKENQHLVVGALCTHAAIAADSLVSEHLPALREAASQIGDLQVRNRGTIGGNIAHADPASDLPGILLAHDAAIHTIGPQGRAVHESAAFFLGPMTTALGSDQLVVEVAFPLRPGTRAVYEKFAHPASGYAVVGVAAVIQVALDGRIAHARIGVNGAGYCAYRATEVERRLLERKPDETVIAHAAEAAADGADLADDLFASADYRRHLATVLTRRALTRALG